METFITVLFALSLIVYVIFYNLYFIAINPKYYKIYTYKDLFFYITFVCFIVFMITAIILLLFIL